MIEWLNSYAILILIICFGFVSVILLVYYLTLFIKFAFRRPKKNKLHEPQPVSVVMVSKNEAHHLIKSLPKLLSQQYFNYEVVVVNDNSNDETEQVIRDFMTQYPHLKLVNLTSSVTNIQGKKFPLSIGIKSASHEIVLLTDPDCTPASDYWILHISKHFQSKTQIVLGYSTVEKKKSLMNMFVHFDYLQHAIQYFSYALIGFPCMGTGKNLAYTKSAFYEQKGFASHNHFKYGDDDLFINKMATAKNCEIEYAKETITISRYKSGFSAWFSMKKNQISSRKHFKSGHKFVLNTFSCFNFLFYALFAAIMPFVYQNLKYLVILLSIFAFKLIIQYIVFGFSASKLEEKRVVPYILFFDIFYIVISPFLYLSTLFSSRRKWK